MHTATVIARHARFSLHRNATRRKRQPINQSIGHLFVWSHNNKTWQTNNEWWQTRHHCRKTCTNRYPEKIIIRECSPANGLLPLFPSQSYWRIRSVCPWLTYTKYVRQKTHIGVQGFVFSPIYQWSLRTTENVKALFPSTYSAVESLPRSTKGW